MCLSYVMGFWFLTHTYIFFSAMDIKQWRASFNDGLDGAQAPIRLETLGLLPAELERISQQQKDESVAVRAGNLSPVLATFSEIFDSMGCNDRCRIFLPGHVRPWSNFPPVLQKAVWVFAEAWPSVLCLRQVSKKWKSLLDMFQPNAPSAEQAFKQGARWENTRWVSRKKMKRERKERAEYM